MGCRSVYEAGVRALCRALCCSVVIAEMHALNNSVLA